MLASLTDARYGLIESGADQENAQGIPVRLGAGLGCRVEALLNHPRPVTVPDPASALGSFPTVTFGVWRQKVHVMAARTWDADGCEAKGQTGRVTIIDGLASGRDAGGMSLIQVRLLACQRDSSAYVRSAAPD